MTAEVITYRPRSAMRDVGRAIGIGSNTINIVAKTVSRGQLPDLETIKERTGSLNLSTELLDSVVTTLSDCPLPVSVLYLSIEFCDLLNFPALIF